MNKAAFCLATGTFGHGKLQRPPLVETFTAVAFSHWKKGKLSKVNLTCHAPYNNTVPPKRTPPPSWEPLVTNIILTFFRVTMLQKEKEQQKEQHEEAVQQLQAKHETDMSHLYHEHALSAAKVHITTASSQTPTFPCYTCGFQHFSWQDLILFPCPGVWGAWRLWENRLSAQTAAAGQRTSETSTSQGNSLGRVLQKLYFVVVEE